VNMVLGKDIMKNIKFLNQECVKAQGKTKATRIVIPSKKRTFTECAPYQWTKWHRGLDMLLVATSNATCC
jgi:hypothetical protein